MYSPGSRGSGESTKFLNIVATFKKSGPTISRNNSLPRTIQYEAGTHHAFECTKTSIIFRDRGGIGEKFNHLVNIFQFLQLPKTKKIWEGLGLNFCFI